MNKAALLIILWMGFGLYSCKCSKDAGTGKNMTENTNVNSTPANSDSSIKAEDPTAQIERWTRERAAQGPDSFRLIVTFISIGAGTDPDAKTFLDGYMLDYKTRTGVSPKYIMIPWGKEGEVDCCFSLIELKGPEQADFIEGLRNRMKGRELIQINENARNRFKP